LCFSSLILAAAPAVAEAPDSADGAPYLGVQAQAADRLLAQGKPAEAMAHADRLLSLLASVTDPAADPAAVAGAAADAVRILLATGQVERAYGLYRAGGELIGRGLPPGGVEAAAWGLTERRLLEAMGDLPAAGDADAAPPQVLAQRLRKAANAPAIAGAWRHPGADERRQIAQALSGRLPDADLAFTLFQLAGRGGAAFDADAMTALSQARDPLTRRTIHEALRLRARRDRLERGAVQAVLQASAAAGAPRGSLRHDTALRQQLRLFADRIAAADAQLARQGIVLGGAHVVPLKRLQAVLAADEAALTVAPTTSGLAYMCVRRDREFRTTAAVDPAQLKLDTRLLQAALAATHAPSDDLDRQFPAEAAVRLYDTLVRPFEPCLKPGDRLIWLPGVSGLGLPLAALVPAVPPKAAGGYDLAQADWLARHHAVSYAGSASAVVAARSVPAAPAAFDFLGVGDPLLSGVTAEGQPRGRAVMRGVRGEALAELAPLPETRDELEASARGFRDPRLLLAGEATERRVRGELLGGYRMISFATHGLLRDDLQGLAEPALVLTPASSRDPGDDGLFTADEIADLNLSARFVALSACNTANFDLGQAADELPALASAFAVAGAPATLATLWPVNSETGKRVVADTFARLRVDPARGPAQALAEAQRAFLAAPPTAAYRHPRFWAPFVVLGDGGALPDSADADVRLAAVEPLAPQGEGLGVRREGDRIAVTYRAGAGAGLRVSGGGADWQAAPPLGASAWTVNLGGVVLTGGYAGRGDGTFGAALAAYDRTTGSAAGEWREPASGAKLSVVAAAAPLGPQSAAIAVLDAVPDDGAPAVRGLTIGPDLRPRPLFATRAPIRLGLHAATLTAWRGDLLLTYTARFAPRPAPARAGADDYDDPLCATEPITWIELHDAATGALKAAREIRGLQVNVAVVRGDTVWLGGATYADCAGESRATVQALDARLQTRPVWDDASLGASEVWALSAMGPGGVFVAATKLSVTDFRRIASLADVALSGPLGASGMALTLDAAGRASTPRMLESGADVLVNGADASRPDDILLAGALGGRAVIFHLAGAGSAKR
jgi:CHAT domain-containing protein